MADIKELKAIESAIEEFEKYKEAMWCMKILLKKSQTLKI